MLIIIFTILIDQTNLLNGDDHSHDESYSSLYVFVNGNTGENYDRV